MAISDWGQPLKEGEARALDKAKRLEPKPWPNADDLQLLAKAVNDRKAKVAFKDGREFRITYHSRGTHLQIASQVVFVGPTKGYAPCGWFDVNELRGRYSGEV